MLSWRVHKIDDSGEQLIYMLQITESRVLITATADATKKTADARWDAIRSGIDARCASRRRSCYESDGSYLTGKTRLHV